MLEKYDKITLDCWKILDLQLFSPKTRRRKTFGNQKIRLPIATLPIQLSNKQIDPTNAFVENEG